MTYLHLHRPAHGPLTRCYGSGLLALGLRCLGCPDCYEAEADEDVGDVPGWPAR